MKITNTNELPFIGVSHDPSIKKKVFIERGQIPQLMMFGYAVFTPGQEVKTHVHKTMYEVFYITKGKAIFTINGEEFTVTKGNCITVEAGEYHSQKNSFNEDVEWTYFGIATD